MARRIGTRQSGGTVPSNIIAPSISGTTTVGQVLTCNPGRWSGFNPVTLAYQWVRGASTNVGTNAATYTLVAGDATNTMKCTVTATNALTSTAVTSPVTAVVSA